ncbi:type I DNA topoisomerase [Candidatus Sneabacter namystus]|uniref:DNA topoisomerase 1 n=1 Tax=Candidatus Sneabacter namystus TaxID=2601646 RepID=A0A5C0UIY9_9RICK|nr:type I DNA topoisomerase [Candidatus Sneabacter namystus]QEK39757.1 type I DNA topoisomerase [Candidatus Sneabacter namystus]
MKLVIVESKAKVKTLEKYLGKEFNVIASMGHVKALPSKQGSVLPEKDFQMIYEYVKGASSIVGDIAKKSLKTTKIYLATDPDREGEAIAWHIYNSVTQYLKNNSEISTDTKFSRIAFNEITRDKVKEAILNPRDIDMNLVQAQQARLALDYLVGFTLSPLLWKKLPKCKSAGRVQSVALRLICEREFERAKFDTQEYWSVLLNFLTKDNKEIKAKLTHKDGKKLDKFDISEQEAKELEVKLREKYFKILRIQKKKSNKNPPPPFNTASLQQEAATKLGFTVKKTMQIAQKLYEGIQVEDDIVGLITYMRTDAVVLSNEALTQIRDFINTSFGSNFVPTKSRIYSTKTKNAQEAHEAVRPTNVNLTPEKIKDSLSDEQRALYELIWKRSVASQMKSSVIETISAEATCDDGSHIAQATESYISSSNCYSIIYNSYDEYDDKIEKASIMYSLQEGESLTTQSITPKQHFTEPPARYSEASLVKKLEELGIGRPSTYVNIISVLQNREYANLDKKRFIPNFTGSILITFLENFFDEYFQYNFTAKLEEELDEVAKGKTCKEKLLNKFWKKFNEKIKTIEDKSYQEVSDLMAKALEKIVFPKEDSKKPCPKCGEKNIEIKIGKFGPFLTCAQYPQCQFSKSVADYLSNDIEGNTQNDLVFEDSNKKEISIKHGKYGMYIQQEDKENKSIKRISIPSGLDKNSLSKDLILKMLDLPKVIGQHTETGENVYLKVSKFGFYIEHQSITANIKYKQDPFNIAIDEAVKLLTQTQKLKNKKATTKRIKK